VQGHDVVEAMFVFLLEAICAKRRANKNTNPPTMESSESIFQADAELANDS